MGNIRENNRRKPFIHGLELAADNPEAVKKMAWWYDRNLYSGIFSFSQEEDVMIEYCKMLDYKDYWKHEPYFDDEHDGVFIFNFYERLPSVDAILTYNFFYSILERIDNLKNLDMDAWVVARWNHKVYPYYTAMVDATTFNVYEAYNGWIFYPWNDPYGLKDLKVVSVVEQDRYPSEVLKNPIDIELYESVVYDGALFNEPYRLIVYSGGFVDKALFDVYLDNDKLDELIWRLADKIGHPWMRERYCYLNISDMAVSSTLPAHRFINWCACYNLTLERIEEIINSDKEVVVGEHDIFINN